MFKYLLLLVIFAFWQQTRGEIFVRSETRSDTARILPLPSNLTRRNYSEIAEELNKKPVITMNGHNNYHVGQQIFYVYGENQLQRLLSDNNKGLDKLAGYIVTPGMGAHKLHPRKLTWNRARQACIQEGGHLAIINSDSEEKILLRLMQEQSVGEAYLGLHDLYQEGDWVTVQGDALENTGYTRWTTKFPNEPDNYGGNQNCAVLIAEGGMDDVTCTLTHSFFCEIPS